MTGEPLPRAFHHSKIYLEKQPFGVYQRSQRAKEQAGKNPSRLQPARRHLACISSNESSAEGCLPRRA